MSKKSNSHFDEAVDQFLDLLARLIAKEHLRQSSLCNPMQQDANTTEEESSVSHIEASS